VIHDLKDWAIALHEGTHSTEKLSELYCDAKIEAEELGFVGVGCITYAENKVGEYQK
jgi:hypothetical protein